MNSDNWYVVDTKKPWRKIRVVDATAFLGKTKAYVIETKTHSRRTVGQTAFPTIEAAVADQNFRCHKKMMQLTKVKHVPVYYRPYAACEERLAINMKEMRKIYDKQKVQK